MFHYALALKASVTFPSSKTISHAETAPYLFHLIRKGIIVILANQQFIGNISYFGNSINLLCRTIFPCSAKNKDVNNYDLFKKF